MNHGPTTVSQPQHNTNNQATAAPFVLGNNVNAPHFQAGGQQGPPPLASISTPANTTVSAANPWVAAQGWPPSAQQLPSVPHAMFSQPPPTFHPLSAPPAFSVPGPPPGGNMPPPSTHNLSSINNTTAQAGQAIVDMFRDITQQVTNAIAQVATPPRRYGSGGNGGRGRGDDGGRRQNDNDVITLADVYPGYQFPAFVDNGLLEPHFLKPAAVAHWKHQYHRTYPPNRRAANNYEDRPFYWMPGTAIPHIVLVTIYQGLLRAGGRPGPAVVQRPVFRHSPRAKDLKDSLPPYKSNLPASIIKFARAVQAKYDDQDVDDGEIQLVLDAKFAEAQGGEWEWLQGWLAEPVNTRKPFAFAFQQRFLPEKTYHEVATKLYDLRPDRAWDARKLASEIIGLIRPLGYCIQDDQQRIQLEYSMVMRYFQWTGPYIQDKVLQVAEPFDLDDVVSILDVLKSHNQNMMMSLQPTISVNPAQTFAVNASLTDENGFILSIEDAKRLSLMGALKNRSDDTDSDNAQQKHRGSQQAQGSSTSPPQYSGGGSSKGSLGTTKSFGQGSTPSRARRSSSGERRDTRSLGRRQEYTNSGYRKDDRESRLPFKDNQGRENYQPRPKIRMQQPQIKTRCPWCFGTSHAMDKCFSYAKHLGLNVPSGYSCYHCKAVGQHMGKFCPKARPDLANMANEHLCARCPKLGHFTVDCPAPTNKEFDQALLDRLNKRFNPETINVNVYTGLGINDASPGDPEDEQGDWDCEEREEPVNLAYYRDEEESDSDPGNE